MASVDSQNDGGLLDSWWSQDESAQHGYPQSEDLPQEGAYGEELPADVIERIVAARLAALKQARDDERIVAARRKRLMAQIRDKTIPATPLRLCALLQSVCSSDDARAVAVAHDALALVARIVTASGPDRTARVRSLLTRLSSAPYESTGFDRHQLLAAATLARRCFFGATQSGKPRDESD